ncbi:MAG: hypothetical protein IPP79_05195 [Chitinophagaceae bacterium]|nr:hypothetical protein [Chitinophagaceae bacterium]
MIFSYVILRVNKDNEVAILRGKRNSVIPIYNTSLDGIFIIYAQTNIITGCNRRTLELFEVGSQRDIEGTSFY